MDGHFAESARAEPKTSNSQRSYSGFRTTCNHYIGITISNRTRTNANIVNTRRTRSNDIQVRSFKPRIIDKNPKPYCGGRGHENGETRRGPDLISL